MLIRSAFSPRERVQLFVEPVVGFGRTKQSFKADADINVIVSRFIKSGYLPPAVQEPRFGDVTGLEFQSAMQLVAGARSQFEALPSAVRARFKNDPAAFLEFVGNPVNAPELVEMGLQEAPAPEPVVQVAPAVAAAVAAAAPVAPVVP